MPSELIIQTQNQGGDFTCESYSEFPGRSAVYIIICFTDNYQSQQLALDLKQELLDALHKIQPLFMQAIPPCNGTARRFLHCQAYQNPDTVKLMIVVGDGNSATFANNDILSWNDNIITVFPRRHFVALPGFAALNAAFWDNDISEVVPLILGKTGVADEDYKIFISYKRTDTNNLAEQLFDRLNHEGFEVFLDRFSINPGINFQERLYQELADKAMVVLLESANYLTSPWVQHEIVFAKEYKLGVMAVNISNAPVTPSVDEEYRYPLTNADFNADDTLRDDTLAKLVAKIKMNHAIALYRQRNYLQGNVLKALSKQRLVPVIDKHGFIEVQNNRRSKTYKIWPTPRPPVLHDFHFCDTSCPHEEKIILGPKFMEGKREVQNTWLSRKIPVNYYAEPDIITMSKDIFDGN